MGSDKEIKIDDNHHQKKSRTAQSSMSNFESHSNARNPCESALRRSARLATKVQLKNDSSPPSKPAITLITGPGSAGKSIFTQFVQKSHSHGTGLNQEQARRRSSRIIARDASRSDRTPQEIQATLLSVKQMHTCTVLDVHHRMEIDFDRFEELVKERSPPYTEYRSFREKLYLEKINTLRIYCYNYHITALHTINELTEIIFHLPCVIMMKGLEQSLNQFVDSLKHDLENEYIMNDIVLPFCESKINLIKNNM